MKNSQLTKPNMINVAIMFMALFFLTIVSCKSQVEPPTEVNNAEITVVSTPVSVLSATITITTTLPVVNSTPIPSLNYTVTPKPTFIRRAATETPMPTATSQIFVILPNPDVPECRIPPDSPVSLEETKINAFFQPFCIIWLDEFEDEQGFKIHLSYFNSGERFTFEVGANVTQLIVPEAQTPRLNESLERCMAHNAFMIEVVAILPIGERKVGSFGLNTECGGPGGVLLPTATPESVTSATPFPDSFQLLP